MKTQNVSKDATELPDLITPEIRELTVGELDTVSGGKKTVDQSSPPVVSVANP